MDIRLALLCGTDIPIPELKTVIHQPSIKEIGLIGEHEFFLGLQTLSIQKNMLNTQDNFLLESTTNFQIFMTIMKEQETRDKRDAAKSFLQLIFPNAQIIITPQSLLFNGESEQVLIDDNNFEILQKYLQEIFCINSGPMEQRAFNPADEKAREIAEKLMRGRQRVAEQKGENQGSAFGRYISVLTIGLNSMSLFDAMQLTMYQLYDLVERYTLYLNWDLDVRCRLAGGKPDSKPDDWMKNIH